MVDEKRILLIDDDENITEMLISLKLKALL
jgi:hypothetical protein